MRKSLTVMFSVLGYEGDLIPLFSQGIGDSSAPPKKSYALWVAEGSGVKAPFRMRPFEVAWDVWSEKGN